MEVVVIELDDVHSFSFGLRKARAIVEHIEYIKKWVKGNRYVELPPLQVQSQAKKERIYDNTAKYKNYSKKYDISNDVIIPGE